MDMSLFQGTMASLKAASDITKSLIDLKTLVDAGGKFVELQQAIFSAQNNALTAQAEQASLVEEVRALKEEMTNLKAWDIEKKRYNLVSPWDGFLVYAVKKESAGTEPPHWICTKCYENGRKSILDQRRRTPTFWMCVCPVCNSQNDSPFSVACQSKYAEET
jgi:hypothetical protein